MKKPKWTVGPLRALPQHLRQLGPVARPKLPGLPPAKRGERCCKSMCAGCPWAESVRARARSA